jgi:hypothetical protein
LYIVLQSAQQACSLQHDKVAILCTFPHSLLLLQSLGPGLPAEVSSVLGADGVRAAFAIWTTTPWTIPANLAVAVNADLDYCLVKAEVRRRRWGEGQEIAWDTWGWRWSATAAALQFRLLRSWTDRHRQRPNIASAAPCGLFYVLLDVSEMQHIQ